MARSREELLKYYPDMIGNTGGNDPLALVKRLDEPGLLTTNVVVYVMAVSVESQFQLLERLDDMGFLQ